MYEMSGEASCLSLRPETEWQQEVGEVRGPCQGKGSSLLGQRGRGAAHTARGRAARYLHPLEAALGEE